MILLFYENGDISLLILRIAAFCYLITAMKTKIYVAGKIKIVYGYQEMMHNVHVKIDPGLP
jgi:hypothetical protein